MIVLAVVEVAICILILRWLLKRREGEPYSKKSVARFFIFGALALVVALGISFILPIKRDTFFNLNPILAGFLTALLTAALYEECVKYIFFRLAIFKNAEIKNWMDIIIAAVIVGIGFTVLENIEFAITGGANLLRMFLPGHILFQFFMGYYYGKARVTGDKKYDVLALVVPIIAHTLFDMPIIALMAAIGGDMEALMSQDPEVVAQMPYYSYFIPLLVVAIAVMIALVIGFIIAFRKMNAWSRNGEKQELLKEM